MRIAFEAELAPAKPAPQQCPNGSGHDNQRNSLLPVHSTNIISKPLCATEKIFVRHSAENVGRASRPAQARFAVSSSALRPYSPSVSANTFRHHYRVPYADCTLGNHVYYARYLELLETVRGEFLRSLGVTLRQWQERGTIFPVIEARIRYKAPARYDDQLATEVRVAAAEKVRLNFAYRVVNQAGDLVVEAETMHVCASLDEKPKRLPEELVVALRPYLRSVPRPA